MKTLTILATGKWQTPNVSNGLADAEDAILAKDPEAQILRLSWKKWKDIPAIAAKIAADWKAGIITRIVAGSHSYGGWMLSILFAHLWDHYQIPVYAWCSADGVERLKPRWGVLRISPGVQRFFWWWQQNKRGIQGSTVIIDESATVDEETEVFVIHPKVDENEEFQAKLIELATQT